MSTSRNASRPDTRNNGQKKKNVVVPLQDQAGEEPARLGDFARKHPVLTVAGGLVGGLAIGLLVRKGAVGKLVRGGIALAEAAGAAGITFSHQARDKAESAGAAGRDLGRKALHEAGNAGHLIRRRSEDGLARAGELLTPAQEAASSAIEAGERLMRKAVDLVARTRH